MAFGEKLQEVRKQSGMTQETFAEQLHVSRQAVSRWESGRGYPDPAWQTGRCRAG